MGEGREEGYWYRISIWFTACASSSREDSLVPRTRGNEAIERRSLHLHMVEDTENDPKEHLSNSQDDSHLHLVGVGV